jgi:flavorubredoxin
VSVAPGLPREIAPSIFWLGGCLELKARGEHVHLFNSAFLLRDVERALLLDTGHVNHWSTIERQVRELLGDRPLDYVLPTHPEIAHSGSIPHLLGLYPHLTIAGAVRDYRWYYPQHAGSLLELAPGGSLDLGDLELRVLPAPLKDMPASVWGYETTRKVLFVGDAFAYVHPRPELAHVDEPVHRVGECGLLDSELPGPITTADAELTTRSALTWSRWADASPFFDALDRLLADNPTDLIAPAHGSVITKIDAVLAVMRESFRLSLEQELGENAA